MIEFSIPILCTECDGLCAERIAVIDNRKQRTHKEREMRRGLTLCIATIAYGCDPEFGDDFCTIHPLDQYCNGLKDSQNVDMKNDGVTDEASAIDTSYEAQQDSSQDNDSNVPHDELILSEEFTEAVEEVDNSEEVQEVDEDETELGDIFDADAVGADVDIDDADMDDVDEAEDSTQIAESESESESEETYDADVNSDEKTDGTQDTDETDETQEETQDIDVDVDTEVTPQCENNNDCLSLDDGNLCNDGMVCINGSCASDPTPVDCSTIALTICEQVNCNPATGMCEVTNFPEGMPCNDSDPCTLDDQCVGGQCKGTPGECPCITDADCASFDDENMCNGVYACAQDGNCVLDEESIITCTPLNLCETSVCNTDTGACETTPVVCDDTVACTLDTCDPKQGCVITYDATQCGDNNVCTNDACTDMGCVHENATDIACDDGNPCSVNDICVMGTCIGVAADCNDNSTCTDDSCDSNSGNCVNTPIGGVCDDGSDCTKNDSCVNGICLGQALPVCSCNKNSDCAPFDDGNLCNGIYQCNSATHGCYFDPNTIVVCEGINNSLCAHEVCNTSTGVCEYVPEHEGEPCDAETLCKKNTICAQGVCKGSPVVCDDNEPCTTENCMPAKGCIITANSDPCDDNDACTENDACVGGTCVGSEITCDDGVACTSNLCKTNDGCVYYPVDALCPDGGFCFTAVCVPAKGCEIKDVATCDDNEPCTADTCDPKSGCVFMSLAIPCTDNNVCTEGDACSASGCKGTSLSCDDGVACTVDSCDTDTGCANTPDDNACNDAVACTADACVSVGCVNIPSSSFCNDNEQCTQDACTKGIGCVFTKMTASPCDDSDACTDNDVCVDGVCSGSPSTCDDSLSCTKDACNSATGCTHAPITNTSCNDSDATTPIDICEDGACNGYKKYFEDFEGGSAKGWQFTMPVTESVTWKVVQETNPNQPSIPHLLRAVVAPNTTLTSDVTITAQFIVKKNPGVTNLIYYRVGGIGCAKGSFNVYVNSVNAGGFCDDSTQWKNFQVELPGTTTSATIRFEVILFAGVTTGSEAWAFLGLDNVFLE